MSWTLAIDTSHHVAVGLARDDQPVDRVVVEDTRAHGEALAPAVRDLCARHGIRVADVAEFAVGMGPGPFTGLRVGIVAATTFAHVGGAPVHRVCSLDVIAAQWTDAPEEFLVVSDARRKEVYWARYADGVRVGEPQVGHPADLPDLPVAGPVPTGFAAELSAANGAPTALDPAVLAARWADMAEAPTEPYYLRAADATVSTTRKSALPRLRPRR